MIKNIIILIFVFSIYKVHSQVNGEVFAVDRNIFYLNYTPAAVEDDLYDYQQANIKLGLPPIRLNKLTIYNTIGADYHHFNYGESPFSENIDAFYNLNLSTLIQYRLSKSWTINALAMPHILSNLKSNFETDDMRINGILFAEKIFRKKDSNNFFSLSFGVGYLTLAGETKINPVINLMARVNEKLSFVLGIPNTYVQYDFNNRHTLKVLGDLNDFSANISTPFYATNDNLTKAKTAISTKISAGIEYNYWFYNNWGMMLKGVYSVHDQYELQDSNGNTIYDFNSKLKPYFALGIKYRLKKK
ncbi:MAG: DUF6268 family outer membrane beta-barrel protein [Cellulophaga sp.]